MRKLVQPGDRLGPYEIAAPLGAGGMGEVWAARDTRLEREVALKVLPPGEMDNPERRRQLLKEARAASALQDPNIVTIYAIESDQGIDFIVMERVQGETLRTLIPPGGVPVEKAVGWAAQIARALAKAHRAGVVHRDLKPGNVMVREDGEVKILDFGLARRLKAEAAGEATLTMTQEAMGPGVIAGTAAYMSPEQASGQDVDARTDIFALGAMLYEMLAGQRPFEGGSVLAILQAICLKEPAPLGSVRRDVPAAVAAVVGRALEKDPARRYQTMGEMAAALEASLVKRGGGAMRSWVRGVIAAGGGGVVLAAALWMGLERMSGPWWRAEISAPAGAELFEAYQEGRKLLIRTDRPDNRERAIALFERALKRDARYAPALAGLGEAYAEKYRATKEQRWLEAARANTEKALASNPQLAAAYISRAAVEAESGDQRGAARTLERALELDPRNADAHRRLGGSLRALGEAERAEQALRRAAELGPEDPRTHMNLGVALYAKGDWEEALECFERVRKLAPDHSAAHANAAGAYHMLERWEEAAAALQRSLEIQPTARGYSNLGTMEYFRGRFDDAVPAFEKAAQMQPKQYVYWGNLADAYRWSQRSKGKAAAAYEEAMALAREKLNSGGGDAEDRARLALYLAKVGRKEEALREIAGIGGGEKRPLVMYKVAMVEELCGNRVAALKRLRAAVGAGLSRHEVRNEPELESLREDAKFRELWARPDWR